MPEFGQNFRTQILVGLKAEGLGEADRIAQEMARLERAMGFARERFRQTITDSTELRQELAPLRADFNALAKLLERVEAESAAQGLAWGKLGASAGAWGEVIRQSGIKLGAYARQIEEESGKATQKQVSDAEKATAAVAKSSDEINALLGKEAAATEAAEERKARARAQAEARHEADLDRGLKKHLDAMTRSESAEAQANARHEADLQRSHDQHMAYLDRELAADQAAIDSLQKQKDEALQREANRRRNVEANVSEGAAKREAQQQIEALEAIGRQAITTGERFHALRNEWLDLVNAGKGDTPRANAILDQLDRLREGLATTGYTVQTVTGAFDKQNQVINAGAAYTRKSWTEFEWLGKHIEGVGWAFNSTAKAGEQGGEAARRASYGWLNFAHAVQDAQYGVGAVLNNIPLVVQGLGGGPGLAGTVMIAAVAFETFRGYIGDVRTELGLIVDPMQAFARSSEDLKAKLAALEAKKWKIDVDYRDIERATAALHEHEKARAAFEAGTKTKAQGALAEEAQKVVEAAGGTQQISKVILGAAAAQGMTFAKQSDIEEEKRLRDQVAQIEKTKAGALPGVRFIMEKQAQAVEAQRKAIEERINAANIQYATDLAGQFKLGNEDAIKMVKGLAERQPQAFKPDARRRLKELPETAEEKEWKDMAEEADKFIDEQVEEGKKKAQADLKQAQDARAAEVGKHAAAFGTSKALGGFLEGQLLPLIAGGEKDPERLRRGVMADAMKRIDESDVVPKGMVPDVTTQIVSRFVEKTIAELTDQIEPGENLVDAARKAIAAAKAKAKAKEEKPEISREAARIGHEIRDDLHDAILRRAGQKQSDEQIRAGLAGQVGKRAAEAGVEPELVPDVAAKIIAEQLGRVRAEQAAKGGVTPATARQLLGERQIKAAGQEQGQARRVERVQDVARRPGIAREIMVRSGGMATPEMAEHGAEQYQSLINRGVAPPVAANRVMAELSRMIQQQRAIMDQTNAMMNGMANMLGQANQHLGMVGAQQGMMRGQMNQQRWVKPAPWNTIPGG